MSDIIGIFGGRFLAIEVKAPGKRVKPGSAQERFLENVREEGGVAIEADCLEKVIEGLECQT